MIFIRILLAHWVGDFLLQTRWMGHNKSHNILAMLVHISVYTLTLCLVLPFKLAFINGLLHLCIDYSTSKMSAVFYKYRLEYLFWATIGLDQVLHIMCLYVTCIGV